MSHSSHLTSLLSKMCPTDSVDGPDPAAFLQNSPKLGVQSSECFFFFSCASSIFCAASSLPARDVRKGVSLSLELLIKTEAMKDAVTSCKLKCRLNGFWRSL